MELFITVNSPGEIAGWLLPLAEHVKQLDPGTVVTAIVLPCQYAGGREEAIVRAADGVDRVVRLGGLMKRVLSGDISRRPDGRRIVLHLGGDRAYTLVVVKLLRAAAWAHGTSARWHRHFEHFLVPDRRTAEKLILRGVAADRISVIGQIVVDSVPAGEGASRCRERLGLAADGPPVLTFLPGSRPVEVEFMLPFYAAVVEDLQSRWGRVRCLVALAPFVGREVVDEAVRRKGFQWAWEGDVAGIRLPSGAHLQPVWYEPFVAMGAADLAVTIPGTNTLQLAALGIPTLLVVPGDKAELIPLDGLLGLLNPAWPPVRAIKRRILFRMNRRLAHLAIPNIIAGERVVPELRGEVAPEDVAAGIAALLEDEPAREAMSRCLMEIAGPRGAAARAAALLLGEELCASAV
jgi:lipid-A-disaccharide synthase